MITTPQSLVLMPANVAHAVHATEASRMLLVMLREQASASIAHSADDPNRSGDHHGGHDSPASSGAVDLTGAARTIVCAVLVALTSPSAHPAAQSSVKVTQITHGPKHHYFGYIGQSRTIPWNASGRYLLALQVGFQDRLPGAE